MFDNDVRSYLTEEFYAKGKAELIKSLKNLGILTDDIVRASGFTLKEIEEL